MLAVLIIHILIEKKLQKDKDIRSYDRKPNKYFWDLHFILPQKCCVVKVKYVCRGKLMKICNIENSLIPGVAMAIRENTTWPMALEAAFVEFPNLLPFSSNTGMPSVSSL